MSTFGAFTVTRASTKNVLGSAGTYVSVANNTPAFEFNTDGTYRGLLVEPGATNLATYSQEFNDASWSKTDITITDNVITSPDGATTADLMTQGTAGTGIIQKNYTVSSGVTATESIFVKSVDVPWLRLRLLNGANVTDAWFDIQNGAVGSTAVTGTAVNSGLSIQALPNGWYRCSISGSIPSVTTYAFQILFVTANSGATRVSNGQCYLWQAQAETGSVATSPIVTTAGTASRVADNNQLTSASSLIGQTEGFVYAEIDISRTGANGQVAEIWEDDDNRISIQINATGNIVLVSRAVASTTVNAVSASAYTSGMLKLALRYKLNDYALYANGSSIITDTSSTVPATSKISLGVSRAGGTHLNRHLRAFVTGATALDNSTLASLTTL